MQWVVGYALGGLAGLPAHLSLIVIGMLIVVVGEHIAARSVRRTIGAGKR